MDDVACITHAEPLHDRAGACVVRFGERDHFLGAEVVEGERESRPSDFGGVAVAPQVLAYGPADLQPWLAVHLHPGRSAATDECTGGAVVGHPLVDPVGFPCLTVVLCLPVGGLEAPLPAVPCGDGVVLV